MHMYKSLHTRTHIQTQCLLVYQNSHNQLLPTVVMTGAKRESDRGDTPLRVYHTLPLNSLLHAVPHTGTAFSLHLLFQFLSPALQTSLVAVNYQWSQLARVSVPACGLCHFSLPGSVHSCYRGEVLEKSRVLVWHGQSCWWRGGAEMAVSAGAGHHARLSPLALSKPAGRSPWI